MDWAIPQNPRCYLKKNASNRGYRNDWCENDGDCETCPIADSHKEGYLTIKSEPFLQTLKVPQ